MKILLAGMSYIPNNFTRAIESYGCSYEHVSGLEGRDKVPENCDAAIVAQGFCSHALMWETKGVYGKAGKPVFYAKGSGFSEIKDAFEAHLKQKGYVWGDAKTGIGALAQAFEKAKEETLPKSPPPKPSPKYDRAQIEKLIREGHEAGMAQSEIAEHLRAHGLVAKNGQEISPGYVSTIRYSLGLRGTRPNGASVAQAKLPRAQKFSKDDLISKVLSATMSDARKLEIIKGIHDGTITTDSAPAASVVDDKFVITMKSITAEADRELVKLDRLQALAIVNLAADLKAFAHGAQP